MFSANSGILYALSPGWWIEELPELVSLPILGTKKTHVSHKWQLPFGILKL